MPRWLRGVLARIHERAKQRRVRFTYKALRELAAIDLGLTEEDCCSVLESLAARNSAGRVKSVVTDDWLFIFKPAIGATEFYLKIMLRTDCIVISFHEEDQEHGDERPTQEQQR